MRKILAGIIAGLFLVNFGAYAAEMNYEEISENDDILQVPELDGLSKQFSDIWDISTYYVNINGENFLSGGKWNEHPPLPINLSGEHANGANFIWTGKYYFSGYNSATISPDKYATPLYLLDETGNIVKKLDLRTTYKQFVDKIGYLNGTYYCALKQDAYTEPEKVIKSTDFENWEETDEEVPWILGEVMWAGDKVAVSNSEDFLNVAYENAEGLTFYYMLGSWLIYRDSMTYDYYLSNDGVYFVKLDYPKALAEKADAEAAFRRSLYLPPIRCAYEFENNIVFEERYGRTIARLTTDKAEVYRQLDELKHAPYVVMNDQILAFETAPVIEDDFTLVPMRFLFEQMGAEVTWDDATQTATAALNNKSVTFTIDDTEAEVNNSAVTMDVPARLINDKTMVPLRFLSEELGYTVTWDDAANTAIIE